MSIRIRPNIERVTKRTKTNLTLLAALALTLCLPATTQAQVYEHYILATYANGVSGLTNDGLAISPTGTLFSAHKGGPVARITEWDPIAGALVGVFKETTLIAFTLTDSAGAYSIPSLEPASYTVVCHSDGFETAFQTATVTAGNTTTANFLLEDTPGTITGTVKEQTAPNDPIDGALIAIIQNQTLVDFTRTGTDGAYTIANLAPGNYTVVALARGFQNDTSPATVTAGNTTTVNFLLEANPGTISGTLTDRCTSSPVPGAIITALQGSIPITSTVSDPSGNYSLPDLAPGSYTVEVVADDFVSTSSTTTVSANTVTTLNFILTPIPSPPRNLSGKVITNKFLTQRDRIHKITWAASASSCITEYRIYRNGALIKIVSAGSALEYLDHNRNRKQADTYTVTALNSFNQESAAVTITLR